MNWRQTVVFFLLYLSGSKIPKYIKEIGSVDKSSEKDKKEYTEERLRNLLLHAYHNVPYYKIILAKCGVIKEGHVYLDNFDKIPFLTKEIIRKEGSKLFSVDYKKRGFFANTSGGSTGEPVKFIQDKEYDEWNKATKIYYNHKLGKNPGQGEIKFWGSDRDIIEGSIGFKESLINFIYNRKFFNTYDLTDEKIKSLIKLNNKFKPVSYWSYTDGMYELSKHILDNDIKVHSPKFIMVTINPINKHIRDTIERAFNCPVYDQYGSREVGWIACQCREKQSMHTFPWYNYVEVLDKNGKEVDANNEGDVIITNLRNYSMPLIRYRIGDVAIPSAREKCKCGRKVFSLNRVIGRTLGYFQRRDKSLAHTHFIVQQLFFRDWIKRFQVVQEDFNKVVIRIEKRSKKEHNKRELSKIKKDVQILMGKDCDVKFKFENEIRPSKSGKYIYTISKVRQIT